MNKLTTTLTRFLLVLVLIGTVLPAPIFAQNQALPGPVRQNVTFAATIAFDASQANIFVLTLTGNVTSSTLVNGTIGQTVVFVISQDGTGSRTFAWPSNVGAAPKVLAAASAITRASFRYDGVAWNAVNPIVLQQIAAYSNATTTGTVIPEIAFSAAASRNYTAVCRLTWSSSNAAAAPSWSFSGPASPTAVLISSITPVTTSTLTLPAASTAFDTYVANAATVTTSTNFTDLVSLQLQNGTTAGTVQLEMKSTSASGTVTLQPGSGCIVAAQ